MNTKFAKFLFPLLALSALTAGCSAETGGASTPEAAGDVASAMPGQDYEKIYYSDATFTKEVGYYFKACGNAPPQRSGNINTHWYKGTSTPCQGSGFGRTACYAYLNGDWYQTACFPFPGQN